MDDSEDEGSRYLTKPSSFRSKPTIRNPNFYPMNTHYSNDVVYPPQEEEGDVEDDDDDEFDVEEQNPQFQNPQISGYNYYNQSYYYENEPKRGKKKRKLETLVPNYDLAPRSGLNPSKSSNLGRDGGGWSEGESFELLEFWGERYMELGRRSLRAEDWVEVAEKVSNESGRERNEMECRNQMDVLKKKYKKEREKMEKMGGGFLSKWVFFKKMDVLLNLRMRGYCGLGCGVDSGEYVFMNPRVYLDKSNVLDEMRDSPGVSDDEENEEEVEGLGRDEEDEEDAESARLLADSIQRFGVIYEKIESSKRRQMMELEKMRRDFQRELELQKKQIVERAQAEIARLREEDEEEDSDDDDEEEDHDDDDDDNDDGGDVPNENMRV